MTNGNTAVKERMSEEALRRANEELEKRVEERTAALTLERNALRESENRYRHLVESVTDYIYTVTIESGRPVKTIHGPACVAVTGFTDREYEADPYLWYRMVYEEDRAAVLKQADQIVAGEAVKPLEHRIIHKDGTIRWVRNTTIPRYNQEGVLVAYDGLVANITARRMLEEQLRQAQKMEAIGMLAGGVAHDFNNILSAIMGYGYILHLKMDVHDPLRSNVDHLLESVERASHLTRSLLAFSRKQVIRLTGVHIHEVIQRMQKFLQRIIGEDIELKTIFHEKDLIINADSSQLELALMNLATNARDAMPRGGMLTIETEEVHCDESFIRTHGFGAPGDYVLVTVTDSGAGMDEATQKRIFEPFFTTKDPGKSTGLGLAIVYGIVQQHSGHITVASEPGRGTTFRIFFPLAGAGRVETAPSAPAPQRALRQGREPILLAEDDEVLRGLFRAVLEEAGHPVVEAANGEAAIAAFAQCAEQPELLILDMIMPKKTGKEAHEEIKKMRPDIKAIFISGYPLDKIRAEGLLEKSAELVLKPVSPINLLKKVREVLDREE